MIYGDVLSNEKNELRRHHMKLDECKACGTVLSYGWEVDVCKECLNKNNKLNSIERVKLNYSNGYVRFQDVEWMIFEIERLTVVAQAYEAYKKAY